MAGFLQKTSVSLHVQYSTSFNTFALSPCIMISVQYIKGILEQILVYIQILLLLNITCILFLLKVCTFMYKNYEDK